MLCSVKDFSIYYDCFALWLFFAFAFLETELSSCSTWLSRLRTWTWQPNWPTTDRKLANRKLIQVQTQSFHQSLAFLCNCKVLSKALFNEVRYIHFGVSELFWLGFFYSSICFDSVYMHFRSSFSGCHKKKIWELYTHIFFQLLFIVNGKYNVNTNKVKIVKKNQHWAYLLRLSFSFSRLRKIINN